MALKLTPDDIKRLQEKELANAIRKLQEGKTLTAAERALIAQAGVGGSSNADGGFAASWDELGERLGVTRRAIQEWRKDPRYKADCPPDRADGRKDVAAWAAFIHRHGLKNADQHVPDAGDDGDETTVILPPRIGGSQADWRSREIKLKGDRLELELEKEKGTLLPAPLLEIPLGTAFVAITNRVSQLAEILAPIVTGQMDVQDVMELIRPETQSILAALGKVDFDAELDALLADLPTDEETTRLTALVTFDGQDVAALHQLIRHCCRLVLARLGQAYLRPVTRPASEQTPPEPSIAPPSEQAPDVDLDQIEAGAKAANKPRPLNPGRNKKAACRVSSTASPKRKPARRKKK